MISKILLVLSFTISSLASFSQNTFSLSDSTFEIHQIHVFRSIKFDMDNGKLWPDSTTVQTLDSITHFLKKNRGFNFEIGFHTDWRASENYNLKLSERRADQLKRYFHLKGVHKEQLTSKGYGESEPIYDQEMIESNPELDQESIDRMHWTNRRVVLKCISQALPFQYIFDLRDSTFEVGETFTTHNIRFELNKLELLLDDHTQPVLDSILSFLVRNPEIKVEIGMHCDSRGWKYRSSFLTPGRAENLYKYFVDCGVNKTRIVPKGYECHQPIHTDPYINQFEETDKGKFQQLHTENRRVVLTILAVD